MRLYKKYGLVTMVMSVRWIQSQNGGDYLAPDGMGGTPLGMCCSGDKKLAAIGYETDMPRPAPQPILSDFLKLEEEYIISDYAPLEERTH